MQWKPSSFGRTSFEMDRGGTFHETRGVNFSFRPTPPVRSETFAHVGFGDNCKMRRLSLAHGGRSVDHGDLPTAATPGTSAVQFVPQLSRPLPRVPRSVTARHLRIGSVETGVAAIGVGYGGLEIVALLCPERLCALRGII